MGIRSSIRSAGLFQYMVAERLGITEATFIRWLRKELDPPKEQEILRVIDEIKKELHNK